MFFQVGYEMCYCQLCAITIYEPYHHQAGTGAAVWTVSLESNPSAALTHISRPSDRHACDRAAKLWLRVRALLIAFSLAPWCPLACTLLELCVLRIYRIVRGGC